VLGLPARRYDSYLDLVGERVARRPVPKGLARPIPEDKEDEEEE